MKRRAWAYLAAITLVMLFLAQAAGNLSSQSPVVDEPSHIARAMAYWRTSDLRLQLGHPPLVHALAGLPLLLEPGVPQPESLPNWQPLNREEYNRHALWDEGRPTDRIVFLTRWPVLMLAVLVGALIFRWAGERFGARAAFVALFLFAFDPNLLAHSVLATTDLGVTFFAALAVYTFDRWARRPSLKRLIISGVTLGLALVSKFSAIILLPVLALLAMVIAAWRARQDSRWIARTLLALAVIFAIGAVVVWAVCHFEVGPWEANSIRIPAPSFWNGLLRVKARDEEGRMAFLLGQMSPRGWWYYFPIAFAVKTPLPTLLLLGAAIVGGAFSVFYTWKHRALKGLGRAWTTLTLLLLPVLYLVASMRSTQNIGYRYLLPLLPFLFVWISDLGSRIADFGHLRLRAVQVFRISDLGSRIATYRSHFPITLSPRHLVTLSPCHLVTPSPCRPVTLSPRRLVTLSPYLLVAALFAWYALGAASVFPYHLAYFNEIAGGPDSGYKILADSNLDWGQDIKRLKAWLDANHVDEAYLAVFTGSLPERYGIQARKLPGPYEPPDAYGFRRFAPTPGVYVISPSSWQGLRLDNPDTFDWFRRQKPAARIGHSLFVYQVAETMAEEKWAAVCYAPDGPIDGDGLVAGFGRADMRSIYFDCRTSWVYVHNKGPGYYVIPARSDPTMADAMMLRLGRAIYRDRGDPTQPKEKPGFTLYRWGSETGAQARLASLDKPPGGTFDFGSASLVGYELDRGSFAPGQTVRLMTWWRANSPGEGTLSAYAHVMSGERLMATGDGLDVPPQMWQPGDVIVQRHVLKLPGDLPLGEYTLHVGLYLTPDGPRLPRRVNGRPGDEHPMLATLQVASK